MAEQMKRVAVIGAGATKDPGSNHPFLSWKELVADAAWEAVADAGLRLSDIDCVVIAYHGEAVSEAGGIGGSVSDLLGIAPVPTFPCSMNCAGGSVALNTGWSMVASGKYRRVLVLGFDKALDNINYTESINISYDTEYDYVFGFRHRDGFELMSNYYMDHYGYDQRAYGAMAYQAQWYARRNPRASMYGKPLPPRESFDRNDSCYSMMGEGCAAVVLAPADEAGNYPHPPVYLDGVALAVSSHYVGHRAGEEPMAGRYPTSLDRTVDFDQSAPCVAARETAYTMAGITPEDVDLAQVYDLVAGSFWQIEDLGLCPKGEGGQFFLDGETALGGKCPVNTDGGNIARGHSSGADGLNQVVENVIQLRGEAGERQVQGAKVAVSSCVGGAYAHLTVIVLTNDKFKKEARK